MGESWESWFWTVFAASHNAMAIVDADRVVVSANEALQRLLGRPGEELAGRPIDEALPASDRGAIGDRWRATLARGESHGIQEIVARDGPVELGFAAHVAHVGGRLVVLVILSPGREGDLGAAAGDAPPAPLTPRELEIVGRLALGATSRDIADELHVTPETVRTHVRNAMGKTRTSTRAHLVAAAICRGFLPAISPK